MNVSWREFFRKIKQNEVSSYASSIAFFFFLSLIPMIMFICAILPYTPISQADLMRVMMEAVPSGLRVMVISIILQVYEKSAGILSLALLITLWSAGKGMLALMRGLNGIHGVVEKRNYVLLRIIASAYTLIMLLSIVVNLSLGVFSEGLLRLLLRVSFPGQMAVFLYPFRFLFGLSFLTLMFMLMYTYVPDKKLSFRRQFPGALTAALGWNLYSYGFSVYVEYFNGLTAYGTLGTIILFLLWLYFCCYILLTGVIVNERNLKNDPQ